MKPLAADQAGFVIACPQTIGPPITAAPHSDTTARLCDYANLSAVTEKRATDCLSNAEVRICKLIGGVHTWYSQPMDDPNQVPYNPGLNSTVGVTTDDLIWSFFAAYPKP